LWIGEFSLMAIIKPEDLKKGSALIKAPDTPVSWIKEATDLISSGNQLITGLNNLISTFRGFQQPQGNVIQSGPGAKIMKSAPAPPSSGPSNQDLQKYFSTPEGLKQIVGAIDQLTPMIGDVKLSEVKDLINTAIGQESQPKPEEKKREKTTPKEKKKKK